MNYRILPPEGVIETTVNLPLSKSVENRLMVIKALAGRTPIPDDFPNDSDDIKSMAEGLSISNGVFNVGAAGTVMRFLTAFYASIPGYEIVLDGSDRMRRRPISPLVDALKSMGADIEYIDKEGFPPIKIKGKALHGGEITVKADISSQFITALMLVGPYMGNGLKITLDGIPVSMSYIRLTADLMKKCGIDIEVGNDWVTIEKGEYLTDCPRSEPDWSAASYWAEIVALSAGFVTLKSLNLNSRQPDCAIRKYFGQLGVDIIESEDTDGVEMSANPEVHSRFNADLTENPDIAQTLAVTCALIGIPFVLTGLSTLKIKETDRLEALKNELLKIGCLVEIEGDDTLIWDGRRYPILNRPEFDTYNDHRMAMAFAPSALYIPGIVVKDVEVVNKSYPNFWDDLKTAGFGLEETDLKENPE